MRPVATHAKKWPLLLLLALLAGCGGGDEYDAFEEDDTGLGTPDSRAASSTTAILPAPITRPSIPVTRAQRSPGTFPCTVSTIPMCT